MSERPSREFSKREWVLHTPYQEPYRHWRLNKDGRATDDKCLGRRPSSTQLPVPDATGSPTTWLPPDPTIEPHGTINEIRGHVQTWRDHGWPGTQPRVRQLLEYWRGDNAPMRPFFCQREAVETLIWLFDAGRTSSPKAHAVATSHLADVNATWNKGVPRVATKMATGTGKTNLMAMIALWWTVRSPGPVVNFVAVTPGLTIREKLRNELADARSEIWQSVAPAHFGPDLRRMRWEIVNYQALRLRPTLAVGRTTAGQKEKQLIYGPDWKTESRKAIQHPTEMLDNSLKNLERNAKVVVFNDEAHHCYTVDLGAGSGREERNDRERAEVWFTAVHELHRTGRLSQVFDMSATPMWLIRPRKLQAETFPWVVSDYSLLDAVEAGLVKVPRVPVSDRAEGDDGEPIHLQPRYRNIYVYNSKRELTETLHSRVAEPLETLYTHYAERVDPKYTGLGRIPVLIAVAESIASATHLYRYIAGYRAGDIWKPGHFELLSNIDASTGRPKSVLPTILIHSGIDDSVPRSTKKGEEAAIAELAELFAPEASNVEARSTAIRDVVNSVGRREEPGQNIRCVVSVGMLTEGWDARNVTHVFGYRKFGSQLLCEQVAGRSLRKTAFTGMDEIQPVEYANIFGVPFAWVGGEEPGEPPDPPEEREVHTVPDREDFRVRFPHVQGYARGRDRPRWRIDPERVRGYRVRIREHLASEQTGSVGDVWEAKSGYEDERSAIWLAAAQLVPRLDGGRDHRRQAFLDSIRVVESCVPVMICRHPTDLRFDDDAMHEIALHVEIVPWDRMPEVIFADHQQMTGDRASDTASVWFRTTLSHWYDASRSELNAAACHSNSEARLASILDAHMDVAAWVRNFRLHWTVPYFDPENGRWARMEPDFVARAARPTSEGRDRYLVIEFKGMMAAEPTEAAKRKYLQNFWAPGVSRRAAGGEDYGDWRSVWIEDLKEAPRLIAEACRS